MKLLAIFGAAGMVTAAIGADTTAIVIGNLAVLAAVTALFTGTLSIDRAR